MIALDGDFRAMSDKVQGQLSVTSPPHLVIFIMWNAVFVSVSLARTVGEEELHQYVHV